MEITRIVHHPRLERARLHIDGEETSRIELPLDLLLLAGLAVGDRLDATRFAELEREAEVYRAREAALRLLAHRARSRVEIRRRLQRREISESAIDRALEWLDQRGYLDDAAFAEAFVRDQLRFRPRGRLALLRELRRKGVEPEVAEAVISKVLAAEGADEAALARDAADAWRRRNRDLVQKAAASQDGRRKAERRLYGHLGRRGFETHAIRAAIDTVLGEPRHD
jgi:regulatory protein